MSAKEKGGGSVPPKMAAILNRLTRAFEALEGLRKDVTGLVIKREDPDHLLITVKKAMRPAKKPIASAAARKN